MESKATGWCAIILVVLLIVFSFIVHVPWWGFIALFFLFLGVFSHLSSLYLKNMNSAVGRKLENCALIFIIISVIGFIVEYILFNFT